MKPGTYSLADLKRRMQAKGLGQAERQRRAQDATREAMAEALAQCLEHCERSLDGRHSLAWEREAREQLDELRAQVRSRFGPNGPLGGRS